MDNQERIQGQMLDNYINILKSKYPDFKYVNLITDTCDEKFLISDNFTIIIRGIPVNKIKEVRKFIDNKIYSICLDKDKILPLIITLQNVK